MAAASSYSRQPPSRQRSGFLVAIHEPPPDSSSHESWNTDTGTDSVGDETVAVFSVHSLPLNANAR